MNTKSKTAKVSVNLKDRITAAWRNGYTSTEIARMLGISTRYVFAIARERNLSKLSPHKMGRPRKTR